MAQTREAPDTLYRNGLAAFTAGDYAKAAEAFREIVDRFGAEPSLQQEMESVYYALGCSYYNLGDYPAAIGAFDTYAEKYPEARFRDEAVFRIGAAHQAQQDYDTAVATYERLVREHPKSPFAEDAAFQVGICRMIEEDHPAAAKVFAAFQGGFPRSELLTQAIVFEARCLFETEDLVGALDALDKLKGRGQSLDHIVYANFLAIEIGDAAYEGTEYDLALRAYRRVRTRNSLLRIQRGHAAAVDGALARLLKQPINPQNVAERFRAERRLRSQLSQAGDLLAKLESMPDYDSGLFHRIGRCFLNSDRFWEARVAFARVAEEAKDRNMREAAHFDLVLVIGRLRQFGDLIAEADVYLSRYAKDAQFVQNGHVPTVAFLRAESYVNQELFDQAEPELVRLLADYPDHNQRPRIEFYIALCAAMQERFGEAIAGMEKWQRDYPEHPLNPEVQYWLPIALYYNGDFQKALPLFTDFCTRYPLAVYAPEAEYRAALCLYATEDFMGAALALGGYLQKYPDHYFKWEAQLTRGDALAAAGMLDQAKENYLRVTKEAGPFYFMALTQLAKVYKALDTERDYRDMAAAFARYIREEPDSGNVIGAAYQAGWALRQIGRTEDARKLYWSTIERYGDRREWEGFDPLLKDLAALYGDLPQGRLDTDFETHYQDALKQNQKTLASRLRLAAIRRLPREQQGAEIGRYASQFKLSELGPEALAAMGDAGAAGADPDTAVQFFEALLRDFPGSHLVPLARTRIAERQSAAGDYAAACSNAASAAAETGDPVLLMRATYIVGKGLLETREYDGAKEALTAVLANRATPRELKPPALLGMARCLEAQGDVRAAIPYYQRIYVMYRAYGDAVAEAYLRSGRAFEELRDYEAAVRTYREMLESEDLAGSDHAAEARKRLAKLES